MDKRPLKMVGDGCRKQWILLVVLCTRTTHPTVGHRRMKVQFWWRHGEGRSGLILSFCCMAAKLCLWSWCWLRAGVSQGFGSTTTIQNTTIFGESGDPATGFRWSRFRLGSTSKGEQWSCPHLAKPHLAKTAFGQKNPNLANLFL